jgi:hypothetical protein
MPDDKLVIFEVVMEAGNDVDVLPDGRPVRPRGLRDRAVQAVEVSVDAMRDGMASFINGVGSMLEAAQKVAGTYTVETVEIQCQIAGDGRIGFSGTGMSLKGQSSMKLVFKRKPN